MGVYHGDHLNAQLDLNGFFWLKMIKSVIIWNLLVVLVYGQRCDKGSKVCTKLEADDPVFQGQRCKVPSDCKDPYNPYCSKWGYCISYNLFGEEGPDQSKGAVEDGTRGQCRDDKDCTPWAPTCSPLGYCRGNDKSWEWDGSFGSPTNPKPGGEQSRWIQENAQSGGGRNEEYYGKIEDDNRQTHVKFRKENPIFYEQIPVLLPRLEKIEKNVYEPCTYCNYDPKSDDEYQKLVTRLSGIAQNSNQNGAKKGQKPRNNRRQNSNRRNNKNTGVRRQNGNGNNQRKNSNRRKNNNNGNRRQNNRQNSKSNGAGGNSCLETCKKACPSSPPRVKTACNKGCGKRCQ